MTIRTRTRLLVMPIVAVAVVASAAGAIADLPVKAKTPPAAPKAQIDPKAEPAKPVKTKADRAKEKIYPIPDWVYDSSWYQIDVSLFRNGDSSNDPPNAHAWTVEVPEEGLRLVELAEPRYDSPTAVPRPFRGDVEGLRSKLPYLERLGVNALVVTFDYHDADFGHVANGFGVGDRDARGERQSDDASAWEFSASDRLFLRFVKEAHELGLRVVPEFMMSCIGGLSAGHSESESEAKRDLAAARRWVDPNGDGDPSDGIDGFLIHCSPWQALSDGTTLRQFIKEINPNALVVRRFHHGDSVVDAASKDFDVAIARGVGEAVLKFFRSEGAGRSVVDFFAELEKIRKRYSGCADVLSLVPVSGVLSDCYLDRTLAAFMRVRKDANETFRTAFQRRSEATSDVYESARLAISFQHLYFGTPITLFGDEVGMIHTIGPMWWNDLPEPHTKSPHYRGDFLALVRMLNALRVQFAPLRRGDMRTVLVDDGRKIMAFARTLPGDEVIVAMNFGDKQQQVALPTGRPGQLVKVVNPQLKPEAVQLPGRPKPPPIDFTKVPRLRVGGSRVVANDRGEVLLWLAPMSVRLVLLNDN